jgi:hypothetical protein
MCERMAVPSREVRNAVFMLFVSSGERETAKELRCSRQTLRRVVAGKPVSEMFLRGLGTVLCESWGEAGGLVTFRGHSVFE